MPAINAIEGIAKSFAKNFEGVADDVIQEAAKNVYNGASKGSRSILRGAGDDVASVINHDIEHLRSNGEAFNSIDDYMGKTSIFQKGKDLAATAAYTDSVGQTTVEQNTHNAKVNAIKEKMTDRIIGSRGDRTRVTPELVNNAVDALDASGSLSGGARNIENGVRDNISGHFDTLLKDEVAARKAKKVTNNAMEDAIKNKSGNKVQAQMNTRIDRDFEKRSKALEGALGNTAEMEKLGKQWGVEGEKNQDTLQKHIDGWKASQIKDGPTTMDSMWAHKVPQKVGGLGAGAWLVSNMSSSKGQMSNSALYGQSTPYQ